MLKPDWPAPDNVRAAMTTREGGVSQAPYNGFNLATHVGDADERVAQNRRQLSRELDLPGDPLWLTQVHGKQAVDAATVPAGVSADASFTHQSNVVCAVLTADCLPVLFCDSSGSRVAAAHAGWRGLSAGVLEAAVGSLEVQAGQVMAWLGPAIGPTAFEVGPEVRAAFVEQHPQAVEAFSPQGEQRWLADLYRLARIRLEAIGVSAVFGGGLCTYSDPERFYSFRREQTTGRMAALIWRL